MRWKQPFRSMSYRRRPVDGSQARSALHEVTTGGEKGAAPTRRNGKVLPPKNGDPTTRG